jgi:hypothetical protein
MSNNNKNDPVVAISQPVYDILEVMANCYNVDERSIVETALKMFFNCEIKIDRLRKEGIDRDEPFRQEEDENLTGIDQDNERNVVIRLKFN